MTAWYTDQTLQLREHRFSGDTPVMVSVVMIAYNVERYLEAAVESVLDQRTNFRVELVIGEDCSTDRTREIALKYENEYPGLVRVLQHPQNLGLTPNCVATHNACVGKYLALLDGDDYWTNSEKLQQQITFLEAHPNYSGSAHQAAIIYDDIPGSNSHFGATQEMTYQLSDTLQHRKFHTSSLVYRRELWTKSGGIPTTILSNERAIYPMIAVYGPIHYSPENNCIYRKSSIGISSRITFRELEKDLHMLSWLRSLDPNFPVQRFRSFLHLCIYTYPKNVPKGALFKHWVQFCWFSFSYFPKNLGDVKFGTTTFLKLLFNKKID